MKTTILSLLFVLFSFVCLSQQTFQKTLGTSGDEWARWVNLANDGQSIVVCGQSASPGSFQNDGIFMKIDAGGNLVWSRKLSDSGNEILKIIIRSNDGTGYLVGGTADERMIFMKTDESGVVLWQKTWASSAGDDLNQIAAVPGGYVVTGRSFSGFGNSAAVIFKVDESGNFLWGHIYGATGTELACGVMLESSGNYLVTGAAGVGGSAWRFSPDGQLLMAKTYGGGGTEALYYSELLPDGRYFLGDHSWSFTPQLSQWIAKSEPTGKLIWAKTYSATVSGLRGSFDVCEDGGLVMSPTDYANPTDGFLIRTDENGNLRWAKKYGGDLEDRLIRAIEAPDGGYFAVGGSRSFSSTGDEDFFIIKTDANGLIGSCCINDFSVTVSSVSPTEEDFNGNDGPFFASTNLSKAFSQAALSSLTACNLPLTITANFTLPTHQICQNTCLLPTNNDIQPGVDYAWQFPGGSPFASSLAQPDSVCYALPGKYFIILTAKQGECTTTKIDSIEVGGVGSLTIDSLRICTGESVFTHGQTVSSPAVFNDTIPNPNGCPDLLRTVVWLENSIHSLHKIPVCPLDSVLINGEWHVGPGRIFDTIPNPPGCPVFQEVELFSIPDSLRTDSLGLCEGDSLYMDDRWIFGPGEFERLVQFENGCILIEKTVVFLKSEGCPVACHIYWPNVFSPNDDGKNDFWMPLMNCPLSNFDLKIFDRWGELLFQTSDPQALGWNGSFRGKKMGIGVFVWLAEFDLEELTGGPRRHFVKKGDLTLAK